MNKIHLCIYSFIVVINSIAACAEHGQTPEPTVCKLDLDELCGARPSTDAYYDASGRLGTPDLTTADISTIREYGDRLTAWTSCAATLAAEGR